MSICCLVASLLYALPLAFSFPSSVPIRHNKFYFYFEINIRTFPFLNDAVQILWFCINYVKMGRLKLRISVCCCFHASHSIHALVNKLISYFCVELSINLDENLNIFRALKWEISWRTIFMDHHRRDRPAFFCVLHTKFTCNNFEHWKP